MKKKLFIGLLLCLCVLCVLSCGADADKTATSDTARPAPPSPPSEGLEFVSYGDGTCFVAGLGSCTDSNIVIPDTSPEGDRVVSIGRITQNPVYDRPTDSEPIEKAFSGDRLRSVYIPDGVKAIGQGSFFNCIWLRYVSLPDSLEIIGNRAFSSCASLENVRLPSGLKAIGRGAFINCHRLTEILLPAGLEWIGDSAFEYCRGLKRAELEDGFGDSLNYIGWAIFNKCDEIEYSVYDGAKYIGNSNEPYMILIGSEIVNRSSIELHPQTRAIFFWEHGWLFDEVKPEEITIPAKMTYLDRYSFFAFWIKKINVDPENERYKSVDNCLIDKRTGQVMFVFDGGRLPNDGSVEVISSGSLYGSFKELYIPDSVKRIEVGAFTSQGELERVVFQNTEGWTVDGQPVDVTDPAANAIALTRSYDFDWVRE